MSIVPLVLPSSQARGPRGVLMWCACVLQTDVEKREGDLLIWMKELQFREKEIESTEQSHEKDGNPKNFTPDAMRKKVFPFPHL